MPMATAPKVGTVGEARRKSAPAPAPSQDAEEPRENEYYRRVSWRYRIGKYAFLLALIAYLAVMLSAYGDSITYDNLRYLLKDLNTRTEDIDDGFADLTYEEQQNMSFGLFRGEFAVAGKSRLLLYLPGGSQGPSFMLNYEQPVLLTSDKYILCYDLGGTKYSIYTSLTNIFKGTADYTITGAAMGRDGSYALVTRSSSARYQVTFWNASLKKKATYYKDKYVFDVAVSNAGDMVAIVSAEAGISSFTTEVMLCRTDRTEPVMTVTLDNVMPLEASFFDNGNLCVLCDTAVYFFDAGGVRLASVPLTDLEMADISGEYAAVVCSKNVVQSENELRVFSAYGGELVSADVSARVKWASAGSGDNCCYLLTPDTVLRYDVAGGRSETPYAGSALAVLAADRYALLCRSVGAQTIFTESKGG